MFTKTLLDGNISRIFRAGIALSLIGASLSALGFASPAAAQTTSNVTGVWFDTEHEGGIEVAPCGNRMCGRIVWLKNQLNAEGKPLFDRHNPNSSLQSRPICGLQILRDLQPLTDGSWGRGIVYDPKKGAENEASIKPLSGGKLQLTGYGLFGLSKSFEWTRAPVDLQRCGALAASGTPTAPASAPKPAATTSVPAPAAKPTPATAGVTGAPPAIAKPAAPSAAAPAPPADAKKSSSVPKPASEAPVAKPAVKAAIVAPLVAPPAKTTSKVVIKPAITSNSTPATVGTAKPKTTSTAQKKPASVSPTSTALAKPASATTAKTAIATKTAKPAASTKTATAPLAAPAKKKAVAKAAIPGSSKPVAAATTADQATAAQSAPLSPTAQSAPSSSPDAAGFADGQ